MLATFDITNACKQFAIDAISRHLNNNILVSIPGIDHVAQANTLLFGNVNSVYSFDIMMNALKHIIESSYKAQC